MSHLSSSPTHALDWISEDVETRQFIHSYKILLSTAQQIQQAHTDNNNSLFITLTYAQSIDGSIAAVKGKTAN